MRNIALQLSFLGTAYHGWQVQRAGVATLQQVISDAVTQLIGAPILVRGCSRTDAGVHALQYIAHFHTTAAIPLAACVDGLNNLLPPDIAVHRAWEMPPDFDARRDAAHKTYRYCLYEAPTRQPWFDATAWWRRTPLDLSAMQRAAAQLCGTHDFLSFCAAGDVSRIKRRTVHSCTISRTTLAMAFPAWAAPPAVTPPLTGHLVTLEICADGFLKQMVRSIAGTVVEIGAGKRSADSMADLLAAEDRTAAGACAPPQGLYLVSIVYPEKYSLFFN